MGIVSKSWTALSLAAGVAILGQFPEFAQQYRQHLEGGIGELETVVEDFDRDARQVELNREDALNALERSSEELPKLRGKSMRVVVTRYENLVNQKQAIDASAPVMRPVYILQNPDEKMLAGTWEIFEPALPLTQAGLVWSSAGALIAWLFARSPVALWRRRKKSRANPAYWMEDPQ